MVNQFIEKARNFLFYRRESYRHTFKKESPHGQTVLKDLAKFCRAHQSTFHPDPYVAARLDGRREVFNRIQHHLQLPDEALWALYGGNQPER